MILMQLLAMYKKIVGVQRLENFGKDVYLDVSHQINISSIIIQLAKQIVKLLPRSHIAEWIARGKVTWDI